MNIKKNFLQIFLVLIFLTSCRNSINKDFPFINSEKDIKENLNSEKKLMEIKFSCQEDGISKYINDGWIILKEDSQEKFVLGSLFLPLKIAIWKRKKDVK